MARRTALLHAAACGVTAALLAAGSLAAQTIPPLTGDDVVSVRVRFGITDTQPQSWNGSVEVTGGEVLAVRNWSVHPTETVDGLTWSMATREGMNYPRRVYQWEDPLGTVTYLHHPGVVVDVAARSGTELAFTTPQGDFDLRPADLDVGEELPTAALALALMWLGWGVYFVAPDEEAVVRVLGRAKAAPAGPGLHWNWPRPVGRVGKLKVREAKRLTLGFTAPDRVLGGDSAPAEARWLTGDRNVVHIRLVVLYAIHDPLAYSLRFENVESVLQASARGALLEVVAGMSVDDLLTTGKVAVQQSVQAASQGLFDRFETGATVLSVSLEGVSPPSPRARGLQRRGQRARGPGPPDPRGRELRQRGRAGRPRRSPHARSAGRGLPDRGSGPRDRRRGPLPVHRHRRARQPRRGPHTLLPGDDGTRAAPDAEDDPGAGPEHDRHRLPATRADQRAEGPAVRMTRNLGATALTVVVLLAGLAVALRDRLPERSGDAGDAGDPREVLWQMVEASQDGAVEAYLDLFAGEVREQLETVREEMGDAAFEQYLRQRVADLKGVAVIDEEDLGETVRLEVEYVRAASYDTQSLDLRSSRGRWRIVAVGPTREREPPVPYGTPVGPTD